MSGVFISYRRSDSQDVTGRIYDRLVQEFGEGAVFRDVHSISPGLDFREALDRATRTCQVMLTVIGPSWLSSTGKDGKRRLDNPNDFVRLEVESGLQRNIPTIPVFVSGATAIDPDQLPLSLRPLASKQGLAVRPDPDFHNDVNVLITHLRRHLTEPRPGGPQADAPPGWVLIDQEFLAGRRQDLTAEQRVRFFDGSTPAWVEALSPDIPRRAIVKELLTHIALPRPKGEVVVILLLGAGGEGKSTALRQVVCDLADQAPKWAVLWRDSPESPLDPGYLVRHSRPGTTWLVASDDADLTARNTFDAVRAVRESGRANVCFLLCARDTDWIGTQADRLAWGRYAHVIEKRLRGLSDADAQRIVEAWGRCGAEGLGKLQGERPEVAVRKLVEQARSEPGRDDTSFLGAMLQVRIADNFRSHVKDLLRRLEARPGPGKDNLLAAFAYIAIPHADNLLFLSREVLAEVLSCPLGAIRPQVIGPLGEEAAATTAGKTILTRHPAIANAAKGLLAEVFHFDPEEIYVTLVRAAVQAHRAGTRVEAIREWRFLSSKFFDRGDQSLGIRLAQVAAEADPGDPFFRVHWGSLLRKARDYEASIRVFREGPGRPNRNVRPYLYEWATSEGNAGNIALAAWLTGLSLADDVTPEPPDRDRAMRSLEGLAAAFRDLRKKYNVKLFGQARLSVTLLAMRLPLDAVANRHLQRHLKESREEVVGDVPVGAALDLMKQGLRAAWGRWEATLPDWVNDPNAAVFHHLGTLVGDDSSA